MKPIPTPGKLWDELRIRLGALRHLNFGDGSLLRVLQQRQRPLDPRNSLAFLCRDAVHEVSALAHATGWLQVLRRPSSEGMLWLLQRRHPRHDPSTLPALDWAAEQQHWQGAAKSPPSLHGQTTASQPLPGAQARRCQLIGIGPPKSATASLAGLFSRYHHLHEGWVGPTLQRLQRGLPMDADWLLRRDRALGFPECDSSQLHHWYLPQLADCFPAARFVLLLRQPLDWLNSLFNHRLARGLGPAWQALEQRRFGPRTATAKGPDLLLAQYGLPSLQAALGFWLEVYQQALQALPAERLMILPVENLQSQIPELARFAGVSAESLQPAEARRNLARADYRLLRRLPAPWLNEAIEAHASGLWRDLRTTLGPSLPSLKKARPEA